MASAHQTAAHLRLSCKSAGVFVEATLQANSRRRLGYCTGDRYGVNLPMPGRRRVFTPSAIEIMRELASQGKTAAQIASAIGSTPASVRVKCCHLKIKVARRGRPTLPQNQPLRSHKAFSF